MGSLGDGALCQDIQVHLNALRDNAGKGSHDKADGADSYGTLFLCCFQGQIQDALCNRELMHGRGLLSNVITVK